MLTASPHAATAMDLSRWIGVNPKTAWHLCHHIRHAIARDTLPFAGPVEADEAYFGGQSRFRHAHQRRHPPPKTIVAAVQDRRTGLVAAAVVPHADRWTLRAFLAQHTKPTVMVYTDESRVYDGLPHRQTVNHSAGQYVNGDASTNGIEAVFRVLKHAYRRSFWWSPKHIHRYIGSTVTRFNLRSLPPEERMTWTARALVGRRLHYVDLVA